MKPPVPSFRVLPMLKERRRELETCVYCPKLCRSACPVSNAEPREALTPWGKMSGSYFVANDRVEADASFALLPWACTGCRACAGACDHKNPVADTLTDARAAMFASGLAPAAAARVAKSFAERQSVVDALTKEATARHGLRDGTGVGILAGCTYLRKTPDVADDAIASAVALSSEPASLVSACCGASLAMAGDREGQRAALNALAAETRAMKLLLVGDPGCAHSIKTGAESLGVQLAPRVSLVIELAAEALERLSTSGATSSGMSATNAAPPFFHDPCHLGRGLGLYEPPRAILTRIAGAPPRELQDNREHATCSGGGGVLPLTMPETARDIAKARAAQADGAEIVTACAQSLRALRKAGARASDLHTFIARGLGVARRDRAPS
jgi:Fe-S oxidoreductase